MAKGGCGRHRRRKEIMNNEAKEEESRSCKRDVEGGKEKTVFKRRCVNPLPRNMF